ncbi:MAG: SH3 domain-containing protein [Anaerolineae bacterium]|nr:SH3 domain-containing protein [Anaerolineae bacterium]
MNHLLSREKTTKVSFTLVFLILLVSMLACGEASPASHKTNSPDEPADEASNNSSKPTNSTANNDANALINERIEALECEEVAFMERLADTSSFIDLERTSFDNKTVVFKDGFVETEYFAHKKLLEMSARFLRDFPCLETLTVSIDLDGQRYITDVTIDEYEEFLGIDFKAMNKDIEQWRAFLATVDKPLVQRFAELYISQAPNSEIDGPKVAAAETNINVRGGPGTDYSIVTTLAAGESLPIVGRNIDSSWWQVATPDGIGWVAAFVVTVSNTDDTIPIIDAPPLSSQNGTNPLADNPAPAKAVANVTIVPSLEAPDNQSDCHPNAQITSPAPGLPFSSRVVAISGFANVPNFKSYKIEYSTDPHSGVWNYLFEQDTPVENGVLMHLETSTVPPGPYGVRLTVVDKSGNYPEPCIRWFNDPVFFTPEPDTTDSAITNIENSPQPTLDNSEDVPCLCDGDYYNCGDFGSSGSAQQCFNYCVSSGHGDVHNLDRDSDGSVCEWLD